MKKNAFHLNLVANRFLDHLKLYTENKINKADLLAEVRGLTRYIEKVFATNFSKMDEEIEEDIQVEEI